MISAILTLIQTERDGFTINRSSVKGCVDVFLQLQDTSSREPVSIYRRDIEPAVLKESEVFYKKEGERLLETCDAPEFLRRVSQRVHDVLNAHLLYAGGGTLPRRGVSDAPHSFYTHHPSSTKDT